MTWGLTLEELAQPHRWHHDRSMAPSMAPRPSSCVSRWLSQLDSKWRGSSWVTEPCGSPIPRSLTVTGRGSSRAPWMDCLGCGSQRSSATSSPFVRIGPASGLFSPQPHLSTDTARRRDHVRAINVQPRRHHQRERPPLPEGPRGSSVGWPRPGTSQQLILIPLFFSFNNQYSIIIKIKKSVWPNGIHHICIHHPK